MAIPKFLEELNIISKLGDYPRSDDSLSTDQFKAKFDEAGLKIQNYINNTLLPYLNQLVDVQALLNGILDSTLSLADKAANAKATGNALNKKFDKTGGELTGNVNMNGYTISNLPTPQSENQAATKGFVDGKRFRATVNLPASGWTGSGPYIQTIAVEGILNTDRPHWGLVRSGDTAAKLAQKEGYALVDELETADGSVIFTCDEEKPGVDLSVQLEVNR